MIEVYLNDADCKNFAEPDAWACDCCESYRGVTVTDVSDLSVSFDEVAAYSFDNSVHAAWFTLTWKAVK